MYHTSLSGVFKHVFGRNSIAPRYCSSETLELAGELGLGIVIPGTIEVGRQWVASQQSWIKRGSTGWKGAGEPSGMVSLELLLTNGSLNRPEGQNIQAGVSILFALGPEPIEAADGKKMKFSIVNRSRVSKTSDDSPRKPDEHKGLAQTAIEHTGALSPLKGLDDVMETEDEEDGSRGKWKALPPAAARHKTQLPIARQNRSKPQSVGSDLISCPRPSKSSEEQEIAKQGDENS
ncbi:hypothetical protein BY996DRAFT_6511778 [Phakopsora pachyrhizi]|nr:hypothetical protein BY996DRAFT_6511778 [Phakopsora pachyrhizi]